MGYLVITLALIALALLALWLLTRRRANRYEKAYADLRNGVLREIMHAHANRHCLDRMSQGVDPFKPSPVAVKVDYLQGALDNVEQTR